MFDFEMLTRKPLCQKHELTLASARKWRPVSFALGLDPLLLMMLGIWNENRMALCNCIVV